MQQGEEGREFKELNNEEKRRGRWVEEGMKGGDRRMRGERMERGKGRKKRGIQRKNEGRWEGDRDGGKREEN